MAHKKQGGKLTQRVRPQPKYLGIKVTDGEKVTSGSVLIRQRGSKYLGGEGVREGRDHTLFAIKSGKVKFADKLGRKQISVI